MIETDINLSAVDGIAYEFAPDVVRIRSYVNSGSYGDPVVEVNVVTSDNLARDRVNDLRERIRDRFFQVFQLRRAGLWPLVSFRTVSQQQKHDDPKWR